MLVAAAVVPEAPLLLPGATGAPIAAVDDVRAAASAAVQWVVSCEPDVLLAVAGAGAERVWPAGTPSGVRRHLGAAAPAGDVLPVGLVVLTSLLDDAATPALQSVARTAEPGAAAALGARLVAGAARVGLLVAGDGSARRGLKAPGHLDDRAAPFDAGVRAALSAGDPAALAALDPVLAADLLVAGRAAWQVLAGAARGRAVDARLDYDDDPFGVAYFVARWEL